MNPNNAKKLRYRINSCSELINDSYEELQALVKLLRYNKKEMASKLENGWAEWSSIIAEGTRELTHDKDSWLNEIVDDKYRAKLCEMGWVDTGEIITYADLGRIRNDLTNQQPKQSSKIDQLMAEALKRRKEEEE